MASAEPFNSLVKLTARAFYDSIPVKGDNQPKNFRGDNSGMGVVVLDALTRYSAFDALQLEQLKPLVVQLERVKKLPAPEFGSLQSWERARSGAFANGCPGATDSSMSSTAGPGNVGFEVIIDPDKDVDGKDDTGKDGVGSKPMPPWLKEGNNLSEEQRGQIPSKLNEISETKDDSKQKPEDETTIEDEYIKAYYEAWGKQEDAKRRMQHEGETFISNSQSDRKVGKKYKWEDEDEDEGIEWGEDQATGCTAVANKLEAQESADEDDGYEWIDG
ncbi:hypothetical protein PR202_gb08404 [Eleusine coracana subsp. coracana]|uniref:Uncharacterized protein n=1 Tax=Eleusine coracana subsp. coracana TaxID=191504 RepID=A0AAV5EF22_ELECO|nr:hypothetical protein PR202_gb08404 [Eleusine coracana subsp. coracana]